MCIFQNIVFIMTYRPEPIFISMVVPGYEEAFYHPNIVASTLGGQDMNAYETSMMMLLESIMKNTMQIGGGAIAIEREAIETPLEKATKKQGPGLSA